MVVEKHTPDMLHLKRSPGIRSWSLLVGMGSSFCVFITFAASLFMFNLKELEKTSSNFLLPLMYRNCFGWTCRSILQLWWEMFSRMFSNNNENNKMTNYFFCSSFYVRQHIMEDVLRNRLFICGPTKHGGMGGGETFVSFFICTCLSKCVQLSRLTVFS